MIIIANDHYCVIDYTPGHRSRAEGPPLTNRRLEHTLSVYITPGEPMERTQIYLTEEERRALKALATRLDRSQSALIREAIDRSVDRHQGGHRLDLLRPARGLWADREDLPDFGAVRRELDRLHSGEEEAPLPGRALI